ncbi:hypothetical protein [Ruegeria sp. PrR005]|uniref:Uncharacterized protein n=1 Tax=Ruegeria sp. PrR005 TaxID=2706882 RepID=A0A6B2NQW3_9RHOB|nr:hypothetical protein [Ruegeria sp. PrR005]NDW46551.1 hypothetical protein [Ruegeria sp. PrR005]
MWCPESYVTLSEIVHLFNLDLDYLFLPADDHPHYELEESFHPTSLDPIERKAARNWLISGFFEVFGSDIRACLPSGAIVKVDGSFLRYSDPDWMVDYENPTDKNKPGFDKLDLFSDSTFPRKYFYRQYLAERKFDHLVEAKMLLGSSNPIAGAALCIKESNTRVANLDQLADWLIAKIEAQPGERRDRFDAAEEVVQLIVEAFQSGKVRTKAEAKKMFAHDMKHEAWLALWREACEIMPELSRPGPRS